uniref:Uncharacterized protein n=1 Tax=viral metagenome TaxID=1070528 RepID=A0A6C0CID5_9ZZZZ
MVDLWTFHTSTYLWLVLIVHIVYLAVLVGIVDTAPEYIDKLESYIKVYVALFLVLRFNKYTGTSTFTPLDRKIVFTAGLVVLSTSALNWVVDSYKKEVKAFASMVFKPTIDFIKG